MNSQNGIKRTNCKYKIGKVKQIPSVLKDQKTGMEYIELNKRDDEVIYGVNIFAGNYKEEKKLGQGTFGEVYKGIHLSTQKHVAMKKILMKAEKDLFPITAQREITILKRLKHKNVITLIDMVYDHSPGQSSCTQGQEIANHGSTGENTKSFYMILPYMVADLSGILHNPRFNLDMGDIKNMMLQILEGINYIHCKKFMHRDIKTANILLDHKGVLKIADFGLARNYYGPPPNLKYPGGAGTDAKYTSVVVTRWYRAPELVLGDKNYTTAVDIWGIGCVFAEFFEKRPILQGKTDIDQGHVIFQLMGTPSENDWHLAQYLPGAELTKTTYKPTYKERFGKYMSETGLNLLSKLLSLDPYKRLTAYKASSHQFFSEEPFPKSELKLPCEESHETDITRYKEEMNKQMTSIPPVASPGHAVEQSQPQQSSTFVQQRPIQPFQLQNQRINTVQNTNPLQQKSKGVPLGSRFNREAAPSKINKPLNRHLGPPPNQYGATNSHSHNPWPSAHNYDRDRDYSRNEAYSSSFPRKTDHQGYYYRGRNYPFSNDWTRSGESRYQRHTGKPIGPYYRNQRLHTFKPHDRPGQYFHKERTFSDDPHSNQGIVQNTITGPAPSASSVKSAPSVTPSELDTKSANLARYNETCTVDPHMKQKYTNALEARIYGQEDFEQQGFVGRKYFRPVQPPDTNTSNCDTGPSNDQGDPSKRNIIDYY